MTNAHSLVPFNRPFRSMFSPTVGNTTVFHVRYSLFHTVGPDSLAELTCIFLVCDAYVANDI